jgi:hypothetical protein
MSSNLDLKLPPISHLLNIVRLFVVLLWIILLVKGAKTDWYGIA